MANFEHTVSDSLPVYDLYSSNCIFSKIANDLSFCIVFKVRRKMINSRRNSVGGSDKMATDKSTKEHVRSKISSNSRVVNKPYENKKRKNIMEIK